MPRHRLATAGPIASTNAGLNDARKAFWLGDNEVAIDILAAIRPSSPVYVDAQLLHARALLRLRDAKHARTVLQTLSGGSADQRAMREVLLGTTRFRLGFRKTALSELATIYGTLNDSTRASPFLNAEAAYFYALALWSERRLEESEMIATAKLDPTTDIAYVRLLELLGWIESSRGNIPSATRYFSTALSEFKNCTQEDETVLAGVVHGAAIVGIETLDAQLVRAVRANMQHIRWPRADKWRQAQVETYLGRLSENEGRHEEAWDHFETAKSLDVSAPIKALAIIAQVHLLRHKGEEFSASRALNEVARLLSPISWAETNAEERVALIAFASAAAGSDNAAASQALTKARSIWEKDDPLISFSRDDRILALLEQAAGAIHLARHDERTAVRNLRVALDIWQRFGFRLMSGVVARMLWDITHESEYAAYLETLSKRLPEAWFVKTREQGEYDVELSKLGPVERRVLNAILAGKRSKEIAREFGRSVFTIRNQTKKIFAAFGVHSRGALIAMCVRSNMAILNESTNTTSASPRRKRAKGTTKRTKRARRR